MACIGVHIALKDEHLENLLKCKSDDERIEYLINDVKEAWDDDFFFESDKAWDAIHRCLSDFPPDTPEFYPQEGVTRAHALPEDHGAYPLKVCVLGGKKLMDDESNYFMRLIAPEQVVDAARALEKIDEEWLTEKYWTHCRGAWPEYGEEDLEYTWCYFEDMRRYFHKMAGNGRPVLFTASQ